MRKSNLSKGKDNKKTTKKIAFSKKETKINIIRNADKNKKTHPNKVINLNKKELDPPEFPEAIANEILNKIISYVINQITVKEIYSHLDEKCFNYLKYIVTPFLSTEYLFYEDGIENINHQKKKFYFKAPVPKKVNTWVFIQEPETSQIDRYSSSTAKIISFKTDANKDNLDLNRQDSKDKKRRKSAVIEPNLIVNESDEYSKRNNNTKLNSIRSNYSNENINDNNNIIKNLKYIKNNKIVKDNIKNVKLDKKQQKLLEKKKKEEEQKILELTWVDLPKEKYENKYIIKNDNEENNILRK